MFPVWANHLNAKARPSQTLFFLSSHSDSQLPRQPVCWTVTMTWNRAPSWHPVNGRAVWTGNKPPFGTSLAVQWLGLCASTAGGTGSILGQTTKIPRAIQCCQQNIIIISHCFRPRRHWCYFLLQQVASTLTDTEHVSRSRKTPWRETATWVHAAQRQETLWQVFRLRVTCRWMTGWPAGVGTFGQSR